MKYHLNKVNSINGKYKPGDILVLRKLAFDAKIWSDMKLNSVTWCGLLRENQCAMVISSYSSDNLIVFVIAPEGVGWIYGSNVELMK
jgi:hypothetical protein